MENNPLIDILGHDGQIEHFDIDHPIKADSLETLAMIVGISYQEKAQSISVVLPTLFDARQFISLLTNYVSEKNILFFPRDEVQRIEAISSSKEMLEERLYSLSKISFSTKKYIFVTHAIALIHDVSSPKRFKDNTIVLHKGDIIPPNELVRKLIELGYSRVPRVEKVLEFSYRGEIIDIYSPSLLNPVRIEYFDDEIDDLRAFNSNTQLSIREENNLTIVPANENIFNAEEIDAGVKKIKKELDSLIDVKLEDKEEMVNKISTFCELVYSEGIGENQVRYLPYFTNKHYSILEYLTKSRILFYRYEDVISMANDYYQEAISYFDELNSAHLALSQEMTCFVPRDFLIEYDAEKVIDLPSKLSVTDIPYRFSNVLSAPKAIDDLKKDGFTVKVFLANDRFEKFKSVCDEQNRTLSINGNESADIDVVLGKDLSRGFLVPNYKLAILSGNEIFGVKPGSSYFMNRFKEAKVIKKYQDLQPGDYVVHEEQGIGKFLGILEIDGLEYLQIQYAGAGAKLYIPLSKYRLIRKYSSKEGVTPKLDKLGGATWAKRKAKIRGRIAYLADRLIEIAAKRSQLPGFSFQADDDFENMFDRAFPYELTSGQKKAWKEIKHDMMSVHPMDRLLTGDVGFGKTEVAFRAAYKAILSGKQVALLCPTTILAEQHFEVAQKRFEGFGVVVKLISRNVTRVKQTEILKDLYEGKVHLLIGTHRILSKDVKFKNLGLLIVDEEQRFGVTHKEKIKEMTTNIDVLTLTATPIPRTLQMSLLNFRALSNLSDPPINRLPIKTYVVKYDINLVREVISRELGRKGQVYFLHNRIVSIYKKTDQLRKLFPYAKIEAVHGQLPSDEMMDIMTRFYNKQIDILVCTSIIETGLDVPNCNTIIVEGAENFGLSQLYQIKGRVGRSSRLAYAYLTYRDYGKLNEDSHKRLKALKEFTELGSGYKIATQDLNIRGAGDILGKEQAGFVDSIGYDAYMNLLNEVMKEKTLQDKARPTNEVGTKYELSFSLDSHIPSTYASESDRINIYRELFDISSIPQLKKYKEQARDIYGRFPDELENCFVKKEIEIELSKPIIDNFNETIDHYEIKLTKEFSNEYGIALKIRDMFEKYDKSKINIRYYGKHFALRIVKTKDYLLDLLDVTKTLTSLI
ncbi:MAG: transcription-repair coupling factor [Bacilli bacterium]|nr:transcription-repair coupling factor [Bacilli bacterium]